jgi:hypothetical protein
MLARQGVIRLTQELCGVPDRTTPISPHLVDVRNSHMIVIIDNDIVCYFDTHDSYEIDTEMAARADRYFKRSYKVKHVPEEYQSKVFPLGLNYEVKSNGVDRFELARLLAFAHGGSRAHDIASYIGSAFWLSPQAIWFSERRMHARPNHLAHPRVLFLVRVWDPAIVGSTSQEQYAATVDLNETRAACIRALRAHLGKDFLGGILHSQFAREHYADLLLDDNRLSFRRHYMSVMREYPICVATKGLHGSTGWKLAEYVAFSKAIITERLEYDVPGAFSEALNYLAFDSTESLLESVDLLMKDPYKRRSMMENNWIYYQQSLRPDALVLRVLEIALGREL